MTNFTKRLFVSSLTLLTFAIVGTSFAQANTNAEESSLPANAAFEIGMMGLAEPLDLINWKIGDTMEYDVSLAGFKMGTSVKSVTKEEGPGVWMKQDVKLQGQNEVIEVLINRADGSTMKMIRNGKEQSLPDNTLEVISQDATEIKVKAGTFKVIHIVAKTKEISKLEVWANPRDTAIDGTVKQAVAAQFGTVVLELTKFKRIP